MTTISGLPPAMTREEVRKFTEDYGVITDMIAKDGWAIACVNHPLAAPDNPVVWAYTIGLTERGLAEVVVQARNAQEGVALLHRLSGSLLREGAPPLASGELVQEEGVVPLRVVAHTDLRPFMFANRRYTFLRMMELVPVRAGVTQ